MNHPLAEFRTEHHLSQDDLANLAGITRQIVTMTEQGIYPEIPPSIIKAIKDEYGVFATLHLPEEHAKWIDAELDKVNVEPWVQDVLQNQMPISFVEWRNEVSDSVSNFGKLVKIQPVTIRKYESGATNNLPVQLVERLRYWGFSDAYIQSVSALPITGPKEPKRNGRNK